MPVIGLDLGGTKLAGAIFSDDGEIILRRIDALDKRAGNEVGILIKSQIDLFIKYAIENNIQINSVGVSVPGISYSKTGKVWAPNIPGWENFPLFDEITKTLNNDNVIVKIDSDRACYILGETWKGASQGCNDAIFLAVGTGIGAGILINGEVLRGSNDIAGAIGWLALEKPFQSKFVECGCFEYHASGEGLAKVAKEHLSEGSDSKGILQQKEPSYITAQDIFEAYYQKDVIAEIVIHQAIEFWGMAVANLVSLFNPEKIIFGGGVFGPAVKFLDDIYNESKKWAQPISIKQVKLEGSMLGSDAGLYGAGYLALRSLTK